MRNAALAQGQGRITSRFSPAGVPLVAAQAVERSTLGRPKRELYPLSYGGSGGG